MAHWGGGRLLCQIKKTPIMGHQQRAVDFPQGKQLPRSTANSTVGDIRKTQSEENTVKIFIQILRPTSNCVSKI
jgi:hypothetical protein